jgi:glutamate---cysteine ligase / carboxylate-amine ligase
MDRVREVFEASTDFTVGLEEEFALLDPESLDLVQRFDELFAACQDDPVLARAAAGELITSEIEIRSERGETFAAATESLAEARRRLFALAAERGVALGSMGTHPWAPYLEQGIIGTEHYRRVADGLQYVAWRNNTFGLHVHVGIRGADRAIAVCDAMRERMPLLLAGTASSPFRGGRAPGVREGRRPPSTRCARRPSRAASRDAGSRSRSGTSGPTRASWSCWRAPGR